MIIQETTSVQDTLSPRNAEARRFAFMLRFVLPVAVIALMVTSARTGTLLGQ